jgi:hypothetical protein
LSLGFCVLRGSAERRAVLGFEFCVEPLFLTFARSPHLHGNSQGLNDSHKSLRTFHGETTQNSKPKREGHLPRQNHAKLKTQNEGHLPQQNHAKLKTQNAKLKT